MTLTDNDKKELVPVDYAEMIEYIREHGKAYIYAMRGDDYSLIVLESDKNWSGALIQKGIDQGRLFKRRNKPYQLLSYG